MTARRGETCEPCGECLWCSQRWKWKHRAALLTPAPRVSASPVSWRSDRDITPVVPRAGMPAFFEEVYGPPTTMRRPAGVN